MSESVAADLLLTGGKFVTLDPDERIVAALAARDGKIVALGESEDLAGLAGIATRVIDLGGRPVIPSIVDSHCHPDGAAARLSRWHSLDPGRIASRAELLDTIAAATGTMAPEAWFAGYRFNERKSGGYPYPSRAELDHATAGRPLFILRTDGHLGLVNSAALAALGIDEGTTDPPFGAFDRDPASGAMTGLVREAAAQLFVERIHADDKVEDIMAGLQAVFDEFLGFGITSVYNSLTTSKAIQAYQRLKDQSLLKPRVGIIASGREEGLVEALIQAGIRSGFGDNQLRIIGVEWCPDCSTSGRTAAYYEPYVGERALGEPEPNTGMLLYDLEDLKSRAVAAHRAGLMVCIEGVGDRGIDFALDAIEAALAADPKPDHRMRVEHCCYVTPAILERLKRLGVTDSSATGFMYELGDAYRANRGEEAMRCMWPHRALIDADVPAPGHSDAYVCTPNPFTAVWAMVCRKSDSGGPLDAPGAPSQAINVTEALRAYTLLGAYSGREEEVKGSLEVGKLADLAVLDRDILTIPPEEIREVQVDMTFVGGALVFQRA
jgi:predicted amidohydrolase YtcJ